MANKVEVVIDLGQYGRVALSGKPGPMGENPRFAATHVEEMLAEIQKRVRPTVEAMTGVEQIDEGEGGRDERPRAR